MYAVLSYSLLWGIRKHEKVAGIQFVALLIVFLSVSFYGILMELAQFLCVTSRNAEFYDVLANTLGTIAGIFIFFVIFENLLKRNKKIEFYEGKENK